MDKSKFTSSQEKIYDDKSKLSDKALLEIVNSEGKYVIEVIKISRLILEERGVLSTGSAKESELETSETEKKETRIPYTVIGPPYDRGFKNNSSTIIVLTFIIGFLYSFIPEKNVDVHNFLLIAAFGVSVWAAMSAFSYLKKTGHSQALAIICFLFPIIGLLVVRYLGYKFERPELRSVYDKAVNYYNSRSKNLTDDEKLTAGERKELFAEEVNNKFNSHVEKYLEWFNALERSYEDIIAMIDSINIEYEHEPDPVPVLDVTFKMDQPEYEPEQDEKQEHENICPACGFSVKKDDKECPDCGLTL